MGSHDPKWIQQGLKIKVLGIEQNQCHCICLIVLIWPHNFFANGRRMRKLAFWPISQTGKKSTGQSQQVILLTSIIRQVTSWWHHHADMASLGGDMCHSKLAFLGWDGTCMDLTCGNIRMTCGSPYMMWPNGRLTCGGMVEIWVVRMLNWKGDCAVWMMMWHDTWLYGRWLGCTEVTCQVTWQVTGLLTLLVTVWYGPIIGWHVA
jgi:hypothetical protein